jgi:PDZ domain-containing protein
MAGSLRYRNVEEVTTIEPMVVPEPPPPAHQRTARPRWPRWPLVVLILLIVLVAASSISLPYYAVAPGSARQVNDLIRVPKEKSYPPQGRILMATVSLRPVRLPDAVVGWLDSDTDVVPEEQILGSTPRNQYSRQNRALMDDSKQAASVVALRHLGYPVPESGTGALVVAVERGSPADGRVSPDDVITGVDGRPTPLATQAVEAIRAHKPGDTVRLEVKNPAGATRVEQVVLASRPNRPGGFLGVFVRTKDQRFDFPFDVKIESGEVGGPSAGLAYTLAVLDSLTAGELTGGKKVAATGTIELDGSVGNVGGVPQKTAAVRAAGAKYLLVPAGEFGEARSHAGKDLEVIKVASLSEAIAALAGLGGDVSAVGSPRGGTRG